MSTPTHNSVGLTVLNLAGTGDEAAVISGYKWGGSWGTGVSLTYSFPSGTATFQSNYGGVLGSGEFGEWYPLSATEKAGVKAALAVWSSVANINFTQVADNASTVGDLRFALTGVVSPSENAHAYYPDSDAWGGDVWFNVNSWHTASATAVTPGTYDFLTILHEVGHAIGLKHSFEGPFSLSSDFDNYSFTIMSYSAHPGGDNGADFYPTTPMWYDLVAIQEMYGQRAHNGGNTTYNFSSTAHYWQTIDDSGGIDTIAVSGPRHVLIDLRLGHWSEIGLPITFSDNTQQFDTVMNGPRTLLENARGGTGGDRIIGNALQNVITGAAGNDVMTGAAGPDRFVFAPGFGDDTITDFVAGPAANDVIAINHTLLNSFAAVKSHAFVDGAGHVVITDNVGDSITLLSVHHVSDLRANDFVFI